MSHKLEVGKQHSIVAHYTLTTDCLQFLQKLLLQNLHILYADKTVVAASVASKDLSDIAIDDDHSQLDEFLASTTLGKYNRCIFFIF